MKHRSVFSGFLGYNESDNTILIRNGHEVYGDELVELINEELHINLDRVTPSKNDNYEEDDDYGDLGGISLFIPKCKISFYISDNEISLDEVSERYTMQLLGGLDIYGENYGYSEWTIMGFSTHNFTIGNHDLNEILKSYNGKYINFVMEY